MKSWLAPTLQGYDRAWLRADILAGITAGAVVIPQAMAYATIAELPVQYGLYTCMVPMVVYAFIGGSRAMSVSTTSTIAVLTASTLASAGIAAGTDDAVSALSTLTLLVGVLLLVARVLRLGGIVENISPATMTGIKSGVGLTVAASQLPKILGVSSDPDAHGFFSVLRSVWSDLPDLNVATLALSVVSIALLLMGPRIVPNVPAPLLVVVLGIVLVAFADVDEHGVAVIDHVPTGIPLPVAPSLDGLGTLLPGAMAIAVMAFLETVSVARGIRERGQPQINSNRELLANGFAATAGAFFQTLPPAGGFSQSALSLRAGARSQLSALVTAALAVLAALFLAPVLDDLPQATLGSMVFVATLGLVSPSEFARLWRVDPHAFWVAVGTAAVGLTQGLLIAVLVGVIATLYLVLRELDRPHVTTVAGGDPMVLRFDTGLYTANVRANLDVVTDLAIAAKPEYLILDLSRISMLPLAVLDSLAELDDELTAVGITTRWVDLTPNARASAEQTSWWRRVVAERRNGDGPSNAAGGTHGPDT